MKSVFKKVSSFQIIIFGFAGVILLGAVLLMLPISSAQGNTTSFFDSLFTSVSAVCVTGLIIHDTATYWSTFGHVIILILIQIGGLGVVSVATAITLISGKKINLRQRSTMQEAIAAPQVGGILKLTGFMLKITFAIEFIGAVIMAPIFCRDFGISKGIWYAVFHSVSGFCNAGFDLMGVREQYSSVTFYAESLIINCTIMLLILSGGIGFLTWDDIVTHKMHLKKYRTQSKIVLVVSAILIFAPAIFFFFVEFTPKRWDMDLEERILSSFFQTISPRTAGFNTVDLSLMKQGSLMVMVILMLIGGSSGSTAGGIKMTTVAVLFSSSASVFKRREDTQFFGRRIAEDVVNKAAAVLIMYITFFLTGGIAISVIEDLPILVSLYETASALSTVGLTLGITPQLSVASHIILMILMFVGRVGGLTFVFAAFSSKKSNLKRLPLDKINVG